jgi:hypothetical protein
VLYGVGDVDLSERDSRLPKGARGHGAGRADEGLALDVLAIAGLLPDEHHLRFTRALADDRLGCVAPKRAAMALGRGAPQGAQGTALGDELGG